tara:strand:+ start:201 stop:365 length:165 start_codon:yes stop_codon:yes gene_type:complete
MAGGSLNDLPSPNFFNLATDSKASSKPSRFIPMEESACAQATPVESTLDKIADD